MKNKQKIKKGNNKIKFLTDIIIISTVLIFYSYLIIDIVNKYL